MKVYDGIHRIPSTPMVNKLKMIELKIFDFSLKNYAKKDKWKQAWSNLFSTFLNFQTNLPRKDLEISKFSKNGAKKMPKDAKIPVIARAQWLCYSSEIGTVLKNDNILCIKMVSAQMIL